MLFDDDDDVVVPTKTKLKVNKKFAERFEHNKKREDLQKRASSILSSIFSLVNLVRLQ